MAILDHAPGSFTEYAAAGGGKGLERALGMGPDAVIAAVGESGLRGRGGAGFPTGQKWDSVRNVGTGTRYAVCNAAEGEPATFKDRAILRRNPYQVIEGLAIAAHAVGATQAFVAIKEAFTQETDAVRRAIGEMTEADALGGVEVAVALGPDHYLFGEETAMLEVIEGRDPLPRGVAPYIHGLFATASVENPTAANNVETLANVPHILREGPEWLRASGTDSSPGTMIFTVTGDVQREGVFELPLGTPLRTLLEEHAGGPFDERTIKVVFPGASNTVIVPEQLDTPLDFDAMRAAGTGLGSAGFAVYDDSTCIAQAALLFSRFLYVESCGQCPPCKLGSGEITEQLQRIEDAADEGIELDVVLARALTVTDGQKCALPTGTTLLMQSIVQLFGQELRDHIGRACTPRKLLPPKIVDFDEDAGRFVYDERYPSKQPDWTYAS